MVAEDNQVVKSGLFNTVMFPEAVEIKTGSNISQFCSYEAGRWI